MDDFTLAIRKINTGYGTHQVLFDMDITVHPGEVAALIGPNGAGKSTLIKAVSGILSIQSGSISIDGYDLLKQHPQDRARLLSVIPQARNLPPAFTVREVVRMGRTPFVSWLGKLSQADDEQVETAMSRTDILGLADRPIGELSGGEQQRVLVARAIAQQPRVMLLDEPTTHLDMGYQLSLMELIVRLAHEDHLAILMAIHDLNLVARYCDQVMLLVNGHVIARGTPEQVLQEETLSAAYQVEMSIHKLDTGKFFVIPR